MLNNGLVVFYHEVFTVKRMTQSRSQKPVAGVSNQGESRYKVREKASIGDGHEHAC